MDIIRQDLIFALRLLRKERAYVTAVVLTLGLCLGANAAIFAVVQAVLLRPLPYPDADRLVFNYESFPGAGVERAGTSVPNHFDRVKMPDTFDSVAMYRFRGADIGEARQGRAHRVGRSDRLVLHASCGRTPLAAVCSPDSDEPDRSRAGGDPQPRVLAAAVRRARDVVGRDVRLGGKTFTIVGVMPADFSFLNPDVSVWVPLDLHRRRRRARTRDGARHTTRSRGWRRA